MFFSPFLRNSCLLFALKLPPLRIPSQLLGVDIIFQKKTVHFYNATSVNAIKTIIYLSQFPDTANSTPIKLHTTADPVHTGANHHTSAAFKVNIILACIISQVQVVCEGGVLCGYCVDLLYKWSEAIMLTNLPYCNFSAGNQDMRLSSCNGV